MAFVRCPFYCRFGACRHGDLCPLIHARPSISRTLLLSNMYPRLDILFPGRDAQSPPIDPRQIQEHFELNPTKHGPSAVARHDGWWTPQARAKHRAHGPEAKDFYEELSKYGDIESLNVSDNLTDHMLGNVYVMFKEEEHAALALRRLSGGFYAGRPIIVDLSPVIVDFSPVTNFHEAVRRQNGGNSCNQDGYCKFLHLKQISMSATLCFFGWVAFVIISTFITRELRQKLSRRHRRRS